MMWWKRLKKDNSQKEKQLNQEIKENGGLEKGDMLAMIFSAILVFVPIALLVLGIFSLIMLLPVLL